MDKYKKRNIEKRISEAMSDTPVILIQGARQVGKSTLTKKIAESTSCKSVTLDNRDILTAAETDPLNFVDYHKNGTLIIDEIQLCPQLLKSIKYAVDNDRRPGKFILTGSANVLHVSGANESLAGRVETIKLYPFSNGEINDIEEDFISRLVQGKIFESATNNPLNRSDYISLICAGGYPDVYKRDARRRNAYLGSYLSNILDHDAVEISGLAHLDKLQQVFSILSAQTSEELVQSKIAKLAGIPETSIHGYIRLLNDLYLINELPPWGRNLTMRAVKKRKISIADTAISCKLNDDTEESLSDIINGNELGSQLETFVVNELIKQQSWSDTNFSLYHYRDRDRREVDIIIETAGRKVIAIEVKAASSLSKKDFKGIRYLKEALGEQFLYGLVLYTGKEILSFGENIWSAPIEVLWNH